MGTMSSDDRSDNDLLQAFGRDGDEAAFEALAARHVDMIFAVSLRRSGNRQLAEEATQNVLVSLSMKARKLVVLESSLSGWLHTATKFEVSKLQRRETRIKRREQAYASDPMKTATQSDDETFLRLVPLLDQAIDQLRASDREVIVRRYLEAMSPHPGQDEMARRLSVKHEQWIKDLTADLGLNAAQVAGLKSALDTRLKDFRASLDREAAPGASPEQGEKEMIAKAGGLIRGAGLREDLEGVLSEEQLTAFDERDEKIWQSQVESLAYRELAKIAPVLDLKEEQKNRVFELLQTSCWPPLS